MIDNCQLLNNTHNSTLTSDSLIIIPVLAQSCMISAKMLYSKDNIVIELYHYTPSVVVKAINNDYSINYLSQVLSLDWLIKIGCKVDCHVSDKMYHKPELNVLFSVSRFSAILTSTWSNRPLSSSIRILFTTWLWT